MMKAIAGLGLAPCAALLLGMGTTGRPVAKEEGLALFAKMMPVFSSPRCINCHGAVDPVSGDNHGGGPIEGVALDKVGALVSNAKCLECHTANRVLPAEPEKPSTAESEDEANVPVDDRWRIPSQKARYAGKSVVQVCEQIKSWVEASNKDFYVIMTHLENDPLIVWGFEGLAAGARLPDPPAPPGMSQAAFVSLFRDWMRDGGSCDPPATWTGTITIEQTKKHDKTKDFAGGGSQVRERVRITGSTRYDIVVRADSAFGTVSGVMLNQQVRTLLNVNSGTCGFEESTKNETIRYASKPGQRVAMTFQEQPGVSNGFVIRFPLPPHRAEHTSENEYKKPTCSFAKASRETKTRTDTISNATNNTMIVGTAIELKGLDGKVMGWELKGDRVTQFGNETVIMRWDLARNASSRTSKR